MGLNGAHWNPVVPLPAFTTDARGCQASVGVGGDERFALDFHKMADIGLIVVILGGMSHFLASRSKETKFTPCTLEKGMLRSTSGLTIWSTRLVEFSLKVSGRRD